MKQRIVIVGISDTADRVYQFIKRYGLFDIVGFAVNREFLPVAEECPIGQGEPLWALEDLDSHIDRQKDLVFVAVLWNRLNADRRSLFERVKRMGFKCANLISPNANLRGESIGENCWVGDGVIVQERARIGDNVFLMDGSTVGHRARIDNHSFVAVRAIVLGSAVIGEQSFIGANSTVFDETQIGKKCLVGACTAINRNVPDFTVCKVSPGSHVQKTYTEDIIEQKWVAHRNKRV